MLSLKEVKDPKSKICLEKRLAPKRAMREARGTLCIKTCILQTSGPGPESHPKSQLRRMTGRGGLDEGVCSLGFPWSGEGECESHIKEN